MSEPKTLSPAEALRALADGKKITSIYWDTTTVFIELKGNTLTDNMGRSTSIRECDRFIEYTEPRPKRKVAPYIIQSADVRMSNKFFENDKDCIGYLGSYSKIIRRVTELEVEIED